MVLGKGSCCWKREFSLALVSLANSKAILTSLGCSRAGASKGRGEAGAEDAATDQRLGNDADGTGATFLAAVGARLLAGGSGGAAGGLRQGGHLGAGHIGVYTHGRKDKMIHGIIVTS